ncbi:MAG: tetratricopeptide repeat protein, partial [Patescibacteria group bacterium]
SKTFSLIPQLPSFVQDRLFNPLGSLLSLAIFLATIIPLGINQLITQKEIVKKAFSILAVLIIISSLALAIYNILPGKPAEPKILDLKTSWSVTIETLKESPLWGIGPANFLTAFNRFRPLSYNLTDNWSFRFSAARDFYLTSLTEVGLVGAAAIILIFSIIFKMVKKQIREKNFINEGIFLISLLVLSTFLAFFPGGTIHIMLFFILLALVSKSRSITFNFSTQLTEKTKNPLVSRLPSFLVVLPVITILAFFVLFSGRALAAEAKYRKALDALVINDGLTTYEMLREAINTNPYVDRYHATYSQVNLALANSLALNEDLNDQDKNTITQLVQQAIEEAKATVSLNVTRSGNWEVLARTYQSITPFAEGADQFSIQSFSQAVSLDPINPNLRIALGGMYYSLGNYDNAIEIFKMAVLAKNDYANAHYNLAFAYKEKGEVEKATQEMETVLSLVNPESSDYELAKTELENLKQRKPSEEVGSENLIPPQTGEEIETGPQIELPEDLAPPKSSNQ